MSILLDHVSSITAVRTCRLLSHRDTGSHDLSCEFVCANDTFKAWVLVDRRSRKDPVQLFSSSGCLFCAARECSTHQLLRADVAARIVGDIDNQMISALVDKVHDPVDHLLFPLPLVFWIEGSDHHDTDGGIGQHFKIRHVVTANSVVVVGDEGLRKIDGYSLIVQIGQRCNFSRRDVILTCDAIPSTC